MEGVCLVRPIQTSNPGTATLSSGYTAALQRNAVLCDRARVLAKLQEQQGSTCCPAPVSNKAAVYASVLEQKAATSCFPTAQEALQFPKVAVPESIRIQRVIQENALCSTNPLNPATRFSQYTRRVFPPPCPPIPVTERNANLPKPTFQPGCTPSRFYPVS